MDLMHEQINRVVVFRCEGMFSLFSTNLFPCVPEVGFFLHTYLIFLLLLLFLFLHAAAKQKRCAFAVHSLFYQWLQMLSYIIIILFMYQAASPKRLLVICVR